MMKKLLTALVLTSSILAPTAARADGWGCEVLLCLSNPAGPMAVAACVPPITKLYKALFKWRPDPFPTCLLSNGDDSQSGGNYAYVAPPSYYDACPADTTPLPIGERGAIGVYVAVPTVWPYRPGYVKDGDVSVGIGDGGGVSALVTGGDALPVKTCVGSLVGQSVLSTDVEGGTTFVNLYDRVVYIDPAETSFNINVIVNNDLFRNIRPKL